MQDFIAITRFCACLYGLRQSKRKAEKIIKGLKMRRSLKFGLGLANTNKLRALNKPFLRIRVGNTKG